MQIEPQAIEGVKRLSFPCHLDHRGYFAESFQVERLLAMGIEDRWIQDNISYSRQGVLRGLHYQYPRAQAKLVQVLVGEIWDVVVDLRQDSPSFGQWQGFYLQATSSHNPMMRQLYIPAGCAHGFLTLSQEAMIQYKVSEAYHPEDEITLRYDDAFLNIAWPTVSAPLILSEKDKQGLAWESVRKF